MQRPVAVDKPETKATNLDIVHRAEVFVADGSMPRGSNGYVGRRNVAGQADVEAAAVAAGALEPNLTGSVQLVRFVFNLVAQIDEHGRAQGAAPWALVDNAFHAPDVGLDFSGVGRGHQIAPFTSNEAANVVIGIGFSSWPG